MKINTALFVKGVVNTHDPIFNDGLPQIAFVGRSNVGKSSIINSLVGSKKLVKTGKKPGKTTEINLFKINDSFYFVDLPGYGYAKVTAEQKRKIEKMIFGYITEPGFSPHVIAICIDAKVGLTVLDKEMVDTLRKHNKPYLILVNKTDSLNQSELSKQKIKIQRDSQTEDIFLYSAFTKKKKDELLERLISFRE